MTRATPALWCLLAAALFGLSTPASKDLLADLSPLWLASLLYLGAALAVAPFAGGGPVPVERRRRTAWLLGGAAICGGVLGPIALLFGLRLAPSASVSVLLNLETTATAALGVLLFREQLGIRGWVSNLGVLAAGVLLAAPGGFALGPAAGLVALACVFWGLDNHLTALVDGVSPARTTLVKGVVGATVNGGLALALGDGAPTVDHVLPALLVGALGYGASIVLYVRGAQQLGATRAQMLFATAPFLGMAAAWVGLGEPVLPTQVGAAALVAGSLVLLLRGGHGHEHRHEALRHTHMHRHDDGHHEHGHDRAVRGWHSHEHAHEATSHTHEHAPDLHHRHEH